MLIDVFSFILHILFVLSSLVLILVILLQEGSGGGLAGAFGGAGSEAFGVKAGGINKFTAALASIFIVSAILIGSIRGCDDSLVTSIPGQEATIPVTDAPKDTGAPPDGGATDGNTAPTKGTTGGEGGGETLPPTDQNGS
jgi:preprotein translocase subunit SecG